jgi:hypothetical protein
MPTSAITAVVQIVASIFSYLAARGIDKIIGKWMAFFMIAFEKTATQSALDEYNKTKEKLAVDMSDKWKEWENWRDSLKPKTQGEGSK